MKMNRFQLAVVIAVCLITVVLRVRDLPLHLDSMIALTLLCGALVRHPAAIAIPLVVRLLTDVLLWYQTGYGFYSSMMFDYSAYLLIVLLARFLPGQSSMKVVAGGLLGPLLFFLVSNFGVWLLWPDTYAHTVSGLMSCYVQGLPFLRVSLCGNFVFALLFLGAWHWATVAAPVASVNITGPDSES